MVKKKYESPLFDIKLYLLDVIMESGVDSYLGWDNDGADSEFNWD